MTSFSLKKASFFIIFAASVFLSMFLFTFKTPPLDCSANVRLNLDDGDKDIIANIHLAVHFSPDKLSYVTEYGSVEYDNQKFIVDRNVRLHYKHDNYDSFSEFERVAVDKNRNDTLPDALSQSLTSSQKTLFFKIKKINSKIWSVSDLRRTVLICAKNR